MDVLMIGTLAGVIGMAIVFAVGYYLLRNRIAEVENPAESHKPGQE